VQHESSLQQTTTYSLTPFRIIMATEAVKPISSLTEFKELVGPFMLQSRLESPSSLTIAVPLVGYYQINGDKVVIFDFWATWCGPCRVISPIFEKFAKQISSIGFYKVDVDAAQEISEEVGIRAVSLAFPGPRSPLLYAVQMPTFIAFKNGNKVGEVVGAIPQQLEVCSSPQACARYSSIDRYFQALIQKHVEVA